MEHDSHPPGDAPRDDRLLRPTRWLGIVVLPVLLAAGITLVVFPAETDALWAWSIEPPLTALFIGSGYLAGAWYFLRVATGRSWRAVGWLLPAIEAFVLVMLVATILHWHRFDHDHPWFWIWMALYVGAPVAIPAVYLHNRRLGPPSARPDEVALPGRERAVLLAIGAAILTVAVAMFAAPTWVGGWWPWPLTPLTGRVVSGWLAIVGAGAVLMAGSRTAAAVRVGVEIVVVLLGLQLVSLARSWGDTSSRETARLVYLVVLVALLALFALLEPAARRGRSAA